MKKLVLLLGFIIFCFSAIAQNVVGDNVEAKDTVKVRRVLKYNTNYVSNGLEPKGTTYWDNANGTKTTVLGNGVLYQEGKELFIDGQNNTGSTIADGTPVEYAGSIGNSGNFRIRGALVEINKPAFYFIGIATENIVNGAVGKITTTGKVRGIQTNGANYGEIWIDSTIVYPSHIHRGWLTKVPPPAPYPAIPVALVISAHATNGTLEVRPTYPQKLSELSDVNGTPLTATGQIPVWHQDSSYFDFDYNINNYQLKSDTTTYDATKHDLTTGLATKAPSTGSTAYIWNGTSQQTGNFNISGNGKASVFSTGSSTYGVWDTGSDATADGYYVYNNYSPSYSLKIDKDNNNATFSGNARFSSIGTSTLSSLLGVTSDGTLTTATGGALGTLLIGQGTTTAPTWQTLNEAIGGNALTSGYIPMWDGSKFVNSIWNNAGLLYNNGITYSAILGQIAGVNKWIIGDDNSITGANPNDFDLYVYGDNEINLFGNNAKIASFGYTSGVVFPNLSGTGTRLTTASSTGQLGNIANSAGYLYNDGSGNYSYVNSTFQTGTESYISNLVFSGNTLTATGIGSAFGSTVGNIANITHANTFTQDQTISVTGAVSSLRIKDSENIVFSGLNSDVGYFYVRNGHPYFVNGDFGSSEIQLDAQGTTNHTSLSNLSYATSGHTDFVSTNTTQTISAVKTFSANPEITGTNAQLTIDGTNSGILRFELNNVFNGGMYAQSTGKIDFYAGGTSYVEMFSDFKLEAKSAGENAIAGMMYYDSDDNTFRGYNGTSWVSLGATGTFLQLSGGTMTGKLNTVATASSGAGFSLPHGTAPSSPVNGDLWTTTAGLYARINGATVGPFAAATGSYLPLAGGTMTGKIIGVTPTTSTATINLPHGTAPSSPVNGDMWSTTSGVYARVNGSTIQITTGSGDNVSINSSSVIDPNFVSTGQVSFTNTTNTITANINDNSILEADLKAVNSPTDEYYLTYEATTGDFEWQAGSGSMTYPSGSGLAVVSGGASWGTTITLPGNTTTFLRGDGTFATLPSGFADPMTSVGDMIYRNSSNTTTRLPVDATTGKVLTVFNAGGGNLPTWRTLFPDITSGLIAYNNSSGGIATEAGFSYDNVNNTLDVDVVTVNTEVYGVGWDTDLSVPTKDAVYDKIESLSSSSVSGNGALNQVTYWTDAKVISGQSTFTYNPATRTLSTGDGGGVSTENFTFTDDISSSASATFGNLWVTDGVSGEYQSKHLMFTNSTVGDVDIMNSNAIRIESSTVTVKVGDHTIICDTGTTQLNFPSTFVQGKTYIIVNRTASSINLRGSDGLSTRQYGAIDGTVKSFVPANTSVTLQFTSGGSAYQIH